MAKVTIKDRVDQYGMVKDEVKRLTNLAKELSDLIKIAMLEKGEAQFSGKIYCVQMLYRQQADDINREKLLARFGRKYLEDEGILTPRPDSKYLTYGRSTPKEEGAP